MRIAGTENTAQYWTNLGSHKWLMLLEQYFPCFRRSLAQQWHFTGCKVGISPANRVVSQKASVRPTNGPSQVRKSALLRQTMLEVKNSESGTVMALDWTESRHYSGTPCAIGDNFFNCYFNVWLRQLNFKLA